MASFYTVVFVAAFGSLGEGTDPTSNTCGTEPSQSLPFCRKSLPLSDRVDDLIGRLNLSEKIAIMSNSNNGVPRLNIQKIEYSEGLHGVFAGCAAKPAPGSTGCPTSFPNPTGMGASFNRTLWRAVANVIGREGRALHNIQRSAHGALKSGNVGVFFWTPDINLFRDPRWGRGQETPGEDPTLTSRYMVEYVTGVQEGEDPSVTQIAATCKHAFAYDLENWNGTDRQHFDAKVSTRDLVEFYFPVFEACVKEAKVKSVMCSYNELNGIPSCANGRMQNDILRAQWGFEGFVVSDCGAVTNIHKTHNYTKDEQSGAAAALLAGTDIECDDAYHKYIEGAVHAGQVKESDIDLALHRMLQQFVLLGELEGKDRIVYQNYGAQDVDTAANRQLALEAAEQGMILLKNDVSPSGQEKLLPLKAGAKIAFVGPHANTTRPMLSNYAGSGDNVVVTKNSPLMAAKAAGLDVTYTPGHSLDPADTNTSLIQNAVTAARAADVAVVFVGLCADQCPTRIENEGDDRVSLSLPGAQEQLLEAVWAANPHTVLVLINNGGPIAIEWAKEHISAILEAWYPGELGGPAVVNTLLGKSNPAGRLPTTVYPASFVSRSFFNMDMRADGGVTYQWYTGKPVYSFGHGLSYTTFSYIWSADPVTTLGTGLGSGAVAKYRVTVKNVGAVAGQTVVLGFVEGDGSSGTPIRRLFDFMRTPTLAPGQSMTVVLTAKAESFGVVDSMGRQTLGPMRWGIRCGELDNAATTYMEVAGDPVVLKDYGEAMGLKSASMAYV